jgi:chemotaxis protein MotB
MYQRHKNTAVIQPEPPREKAPRGGDPWLSMSAGRPPEQAIWLISYLDVMTILFTFFVLLFAYQKAISGPASEGKKPQTVAMQTQSTAQPKAAPTTQTSRKPEPTKLAVAAMKNQAPLHIAQAQDTPAPKRSETHGGASSAFGRTDTGLPTGLSQLPPNIDQTLAAMSSEFRLESSRKQLELSASDGVVRMEVNDAILFDPGQAELKADGVGILDRIFPILMKQPGTVFVEGHTDRAPIASARYPSNWELSTARATAVTRYLVSKGVDANRLRAVGVADTHPKADNETPQGRAANRRVSLVLGG